MIHQSYLFFVFFLGKSSVELITDALFIGAILSLIAINLKSMVLPNKITYSGLAFAIVVRTFVPNVSSFGLLQEAPISNLPPPLLSIDGAILGAIIGGGTLLLLRWGWERFRGVELLGLGDVKMMCMIGAYLGIAKTVLVLSLVVILMIPTTIVFVLIFLKRKNLLLPSGFLWGTPAIIVTLFGEYILRWIM